MFSDIQSNNVGQIYLFYTFVMPFKESCSDALLLDITSSIYDKSCVFMTEVAFKKEQTGRGKGGEGSEGER